MYVYNIIFKLFNINACIVQRNYSENFAWQTKVKRQKPKEFIKF